MPELEYEVVKIKEVIPGDDQYTITGDSGWSFCLDKKYGVKPRVGDTLETYGGLGRPLRGVCINGKTAYFKGEVQMEEEHKQWKKETAAEYLADYKKLVKEISKEPERVCSNISGMGGGYEMTCQKMLWAGVEFLKDKPDFVFDYKGYKNVYGLCWSDSPDAKALDAVLMKACEGDCTGAMHQCVVMHLGYIHKNGYEKWLKDRGEENQYTYPEGLPLPVFCE